MLGGRRGGGGGRFASILVCCNLVYSCDLHASQVRSHLTNVQDLGVALSRGKYSKVQNQDVALMTESVEMPVFTELAALRRKDGATLAATLHQSCATIIDLLLAGFQASGCKLRVISWSLETLSVQTKMPASDCGRQCRNTSQTLCMCRWFLQSARVTSPTWRCKLQFVDPVERRSGWKAKFARTAAGFTNTWLVTMWRSGATTCRPTCSSTQTKCSTQSLQIA